MAPVDIWWRAVDKQYADYDPWAEWEQPTTSHTRITFWPVTIISTTPKGVFCYDGLSGERRFILGTALKQYAVPTKELALRDLIARKQRQASIYEARAKTARNTIRMAAGMLEKEQLTSSESSRIQHSYGST